MRLLSARVWTTLVAAAGIVLVGIQAIPYGREQTNPPVIAEPQWDSPVTRDLARRACYDCHSNETEWPWYSRVAPVSWLVSQDVDKGRAVLNFSEWQRPQEEAGESAGAVLEGEMPPWIYTVMHSHARLTDAEQTTLARGLRATLGTGPEEGARGR